MGFSAFLKGLFPSCVLKAASLLLAVRSDDHKVDAFFSLSCSLMPSLFGLSVPQLQALQ